MPGELKLVRISTDVASGPQPTEEQLGEIAAHGYRSVVCCRSDGEEGPFLSPEQEEQIVHSLGMEYLHVPLTVHDFTSEAVDEFRRNFQSLPRPVFAHCRTGKRSGALAVMDKAVTDGMTGLQALKKLEMVGSPSDPNLQRFIRHYVESRREKK